MKNLKAPLGIYGVLGNHDWWYNGEKVRHAFENQGIPILDDEVKELNWRGRSFWLAGLADLWTRPQHVAATIAKAPVGSNVIALTHHYLAYRGTSEAQTDELNLMRKMVSAHALTFRVGVSEDEGTQDLYGAAGVPTMAIIDRAGVVRE